MTYEAVQDRTNSSEWRVEAIDYESEGEIFVALFSGPKAKERAEEYAVWKNESASKPLRKAG
jgi:hypothetical protein